MPAGRAGALNEPSVPLVKVRSAPVPLSCTITLAFGITAPLSSVTTPEMVPVGTWAHAVTHKTVASKINADRTFDMEVPFSECSNLRPWLGQFCGIGRAVSRACCYILNTGGKRFH